VFLKILMKHFKHYWKFVKATINYGRIWLPVKEFIHVYENRDWKNSGIEVKFLGMTLRFSSRQYVCSTEIQRQ